MASNLPHLNHGHRRIGASYITGSMQIAPDRMVLESNNGGGPVAFAHVPNRLGRVVKVLREQGRFEREYKERQFIAKGGFGNIYRAVRNWDGRYCAIKQIPLKKLSFDLQKLSTVDDKELLRLLSHDRVYSRKLREILIFGRMAHRNVNHMEDAWISHDATPALVLNIEMPLFEIDLSEFVLPPPPGIVRRRNPFGFQAAIELFMPILSGVEYIHSQGIVHRDLKPHNILLSFERGGVPIPHITDFGSAIFLPSPDSTITKQGSSGTKYFRPPPDGSDNAASAFARADDPQTIWTICPKTDIFALGVILFTLSWEIPRESRSTYWSVLTEQRLFPPGYIRKLNEGHIPGLAIDFAECIRECLERDRTKRISMIRLVYALRTIYRNVLVPCPPATLHI
ncbi:hypothetical protein RUND412_001558 [Rhizina undulata]